jgi:hypothetical protein
MRSFFLFILMIRAFSAIEVTCHSQQAGNRKKLVLVEQNCWTIESCYESQWKFEQI